MSFMRVSPGNHAPDNVNVIIEIPMQSDPVKYEVDKETGLLVVDRFMSTAMFYPCNYGYVPQTLSEDGDPVDVLVMTPVPLLPGAIVQARPIGILKMTDESGRDAKILSVPIDKLLPIYANVREPEDLPSHLLAMISHFFEHYKDLELGKWVKVDGWGSSEEARAEIAKSIARFKEVK